MNVDLEEGHGAGTGDGRRALHYRRSDGGGDGSGGRRARRINRRREQGWMLTLTIHAVYLASNGLLYMVIQIKYQNLRNSPFDTHMVMTSSLVALCVYFLAAALQTILVQTNNEFDDPRLLNHVILCSGILSQLSNALVFLPNLVGWIVVVQFVFATTILLAYDVFKLITNYISKRNDGSIINAAPTPESLALEMSTGINHNAATTTESLALEMSTNGIDSSESCSNDSDAVEMRTGNNFRGSTHPITPFHLFLNQGFGD